MANKLVSFTNYNLAFLAIGQSSENINDLEIIVWELVIVLWKKYLWVIDLYCSVLHDFPITDVADSNRLR